MNIYNIHPSLGANARLRTQIDQTTQHTNLELFTALLCSWTLRCLVCAISRDFSLGIYGDADTLTERLSDWPIRCAIVCINVYSEAVSAARDAECKLSEVIFGHSGDIVFVQRCEFGALVRSSVGLCASRAHVAFLLQYSLCAQTFRFQMDVHCTLYTYLVGFYCTLPPSTTPHIHLFLCVFIVFCFVISSRCRSFHVLLCTKIYRVQFQIRLLFICH